LSLDVNLDNHQNIKDLNKTIEKIESFERLLKLSKDRKLVKLPIIVKPCFLRFVKFLPISEIVIVFCITLYFIFTKTIKWFEYSVLIIMLSNNINKISFLEKFPRLLQLFLQNKHF